MEDEEAPPRRKHPCDAQLESQVHEVLSGNVHKEGSRIGGSTLCEICRLPGEDVGEEVLGLVPVGDLLAVLVDSVVVELPYVELTVPLVPARRDVSRITGRIAVQALPKKAVW